MALTFLAILRDRTCLCVVASERAVPNYERGTFDSIRVACGGHRRRSWEWKADMKVRSCQMDRRGSWVKPPPTDLDSPSTLVLLFAGGQEDQPDRLSPEIFAAFPTSVILGCSTAGEILGSHVYDDTITVAVAQFEHTRLRRAVAPLASAEQSLAAGESLARELNGDDLAAVVVLAPGLEVNGSDLVRGLAAHLPPNVVITGGLAGDGPRFGRTWVVERDEPQPGLATAVGFYGDRLQVGCGTRGGWEGFGPERLITRSEGNVLYELDGRPALTLYREYLGDLAVNLPASGLRFPLAVRESAAVDRSLVRSLLAVDNEAMSMTFAGDVPQGWRAQLMGADTDRLVEGASTAANQALVGMAPGGVLAIAISCVGRRMVMGEMVEEELERTSERLPEDSVQVGFYSYGELSPSGLGVCELHNQTMTFTTLNEA